MMQELKRVTNGYVAYISRSFRSPPLKPRLFHLLALVLLGAGAETLATDGLQVTQVGRWGPGDYYNVAVDGHYAHAVAGSTGLDVLDISNPANPRRIGGLDTPGTAFDIEVVDRYAYVADGDAGLQVIDISNPAVPMRVGGADTAGIAVGISVVGRYAYVADGGAGLQVIDVGNPTAPILVGTYATPGQAITGVAVAGNYAYAVDYASGLLVIDVSDPTQPVRLGSYRHSLGAASVAVSGAHAYVAWGSHGLIIVDIGSPAAPRLVGEYDITAGSALRVTLADGKAYLAYEDAGLHVIDVSNPADPRRAGSYDTSGTANGVAVAGIYAYVADGANGLEVIDISRFPNAPARVGGYGPPGEAIRGIASAGNYAYAAAGSSGLLVIDISDPNVPERVASVDTTNALGVVVAGDHAYVADADGGLQIIDIADPPNPVLVGNLPTYSRTFDVAVGGNYAYLAVESHGLLVVAISDPANPVLVGDIDTYGFEFSVAVEGDFAYLLSSALNVIDISGIADPTWVGSSGGLGGGYPEKVAVYGGYAYVAHGNSGVQVIGIGNPTAPTWAARLNDISGYAYDVAATANRLYLADGNSGVKVIDTAYPADPRVIAAFQTVSGASGINVSGGHVYVGDGGGRFYILEVPGPDRYYSQMQEVYIAYYGRPADPGGRQWWAEQLWEGDGNLSAIIQQFGFSAEFDESYGHLGVGELVDTVYINMFGRDPDDAGRAFYVGELESGNMTLQTVTLDILNGAQNEDATIVANKVECAEYFTAEVRSRGLSYTSDHILDARDMLRLVDESVESVDDCRVEADSLLTTMGN